jgi:cellobiose phosphorylase
MDWTLTPQGFTLTKPLQYRPWYHIMGNANYGLRVSHLGDGYSTTLQEPRTAVTHYDYYSPVKGRFLYVKDGDTVWSPGYLPTKTPLDAYSSTHAPGFTRWVSRKNDLEVTFTLFVPRSGTCELWLVSVTNHRKAKAEIQIFPQAEFLLFPSHAVDPTYNSWYTNSRYDAAKQAILPEKLLAPKTTGFFRSVTPPDAYETSLKLFCGNGDTQNPESVRLGQLGNHPHSGGDPMIGAFQLNLKLGPAGTTGSTQNHVFALGVGETTLDDVVDRYPDFASAQAGLDAVTAGLARVLTRAELKRLPPGQFTNWLNTFFPYQIRQQSLGMVRGEYRGFRDVAQDSMGLVYFDQVSARGLLNQMVTKQYANGRCLRQWHTAGGANDERDFRDLPFWTPIALAHYIDETKDATILNDRARWMDAEELSTLLEHAVTGCEYALQLGEHGLVKMGVGDWNDALSGLGMEGGSVWLNMFAYLALEKLERLYQIAREQLGSTEACPLPVAALRDKLYEGAMKYWNGTHFSRGITDKGVVVGAHERIFLLPQFWFALSGMALRNPALSAIAIQTALDKLESDDGLLKCYPGFAEHDPIVGNLSTLTPGMAENFAVYNHSCAFAIEALLQVGRTDDAIRLLKKLIPFYKDHTKTRCEPYVLVNFYNGGYYEWKKGEGGIPWLTGTANWMAKIVFEQLLPKGLIGRL